MADTAVTTEVPAEVRGRDQQQPDSYVLDPAGRPPARGREDETEIVVRPLLYFSEDSPERADGGENPETPDADEDPENPEAELLFRDRSHLE